MSIDAAAAAATALESRTISDSIATTAAATTTTTKKNQIGGSSSSTMPLPPPPPPFINPYSNHRQLTLKEQEVLGEYVKLSLKIRNIVLLTNTLTTNERHSTLLQDLRILERKMGLVLTLFKASVWSLIQSHQDENEDEENEENEAVQYHHLQN